MFGRNGDKSRSDSRVLLGHKPQHVLKGKKPTCFLFVFQLGQLGVKVGFDGARFIERQRHAKLFNYPLGYLGG